MVIRQSDSGSSPAETATEIVAEEVGEGTAENSAEREAEGEKQGIKQDIKQGETEGGITATGYAAALRAEQDYVSMLYGLLDQARERSVRELSTVRAQGGAGGTHQARLERDISASEQARRLAQLDLTERGLCFGRTDDEKRDTLYIGRIGLRDDNYELKLIDWRAPAARPFYAATPGSPAGLVRRRH